MSCVELHRGTLVKVNTKGLTVLRKKDRLHLKRYGGDLCAAIRS